MNPLKRTLTAIGYNDVLKASLLSVVVRILGAFAGFAATFNIALSLGVEESGYYFLAFSLISILAALSQLGMENMLVRFVGTDHAQGSSVLVKAVFASGVFSFLTAFILFISSSFLANNIFHKPDLEPVLAAMSLGVVGLALLTLCANALQGLHRVVASIFILNISVNLLLILAVLSGFVLKADTLARFYSVAAIFTAVTGMALFWRFKPKVPTAAVPWNVIWASCLPLWAVMIMSQMVQWSGQFIAGAYVSSELVAQLAVAQRTAMLASFVLIAVNLVVAPRFAALHRQGDMAGLESLAILSVKLIGVLALPVIGVMLIFPSWLMGLFGEGFAGGSQLLQILAVGQFINAITGSVGYLLIMSGHERDMRNVTLISGSTALILTWLLTIGFGATGNAVGTAIAVATQNLLAVYFVKKRLGFNTLAVWR
ncbi:oligosaccharide flippase family protein [Spongiibacter tropicus]|uniref:oligosaccharide flippase family protein n=1 Tax=Spongiibacter tropicus TaxID=454602 RepID=UPI00300BF690